MKGYFHGSMFLGMAAGPMFGGYLGMSGGESRPLLIFYTALVRISFLYPFFGYLLNSSQGHAGLCNRFPAFPCT